MKKNQPHTNEIFREELNPNPTKKNVIIISPAPTHPPTSGNRIRILAIAEQLLALGHEVHFAIIPMDNFPIDEMKRFWGDRLHLLRYSRPQPRNDLLAKIQRRIKRQIFSGSQHNLGIDDWFDPELTAQLIELQNLYQFTTAIVEYVFMSKALEAFPENVLKLIDTHDVFSNRYKHFTKNAMKPSWFSTSQAGEAKALRRAHTVIAIQEIERQFFEKISETKTVTVGHLVKIRNCYRDANVNPKIIFIGSDNAVNIQSYQYFIQHSWPLIINRLPKLRLSLVGRICNQVGEAPSVDKLGEIPDLLDSYADVDAVVAPIYLGTGLNIKVIEALGYGMPIVTTPMGAKGIDAKEAMLVRESPEEFADAVVRIVTDRPLRASLSAKALEFAEAWNSRQIRTLAATVSQNP